MNLEELVDELRVGLGISSKEDKKVPCGKCGRTSYNDIRGRLGDCCLKKESLPERMNALLKESP